MVSMGVVYKLRKEVIDFIIDQKKSDAQLSCRRLVAIVEEKFQINVSKSAINQIIKDAQLSNPVGRTAVLTDKKVKKFQIPVEKKQQLFTIPNLLLAPKKESPLVWTSSKKDLKAEKIESMHDRLGLFFLKAAEWDLGERFLMGRFLEKFLEGNIFNPDEVNQLGEVLLWAPSFGINKPEDFNSYKGTGLALLSGIEKIRFDRLLKLLDSISDLRTLSLVVGNEIPQIFAEANSLKITLKDKTEVFLDAREQVVFQSGERGAGLSLGRFIKQVTRRFITNLDYITIYDKGLAENIPNELKLVESLEGISNEMSKLEILDQNDNELAQFNVIPKKKRQFLFVTRPERISSVSNILQDIKLKKFYCKDLDKTFYVGEHEVQGETLGVTKEIPLKLIILSEENKVNAVSSLIFTNNLNFDYKEDVNFSLLLNKNDSLDNKEIKNSIIPFDFYEKMVASDPMQVPTLLENAFVISLALNEYAKCHFFSQNCKELDFNQMCERFYKLAGRFQKIGQKIIVKLQVPTDYQYRKELEFAIKMLKNMNIQDPSGSFFAMDVLI